MQFGFDQDFVEVKIALNVAREDAEFLYDEIEGLIAICLENITSQKNGVPIERIMTPTALTGYLVEKLNKPEVVVKSVQSVMNPMQFSNTLLIYIVVPNLWAVNFGKEVEGLDETLEYLKNPTPVEKADPARPTQQLFNGKTAAPIIGSMYYDQLTCEMKLWDGVQWRVAA